MSHCLPSAHKEKFSMYIYTHSIIKFLGILFTINHIIYGMQHNNNINIPDHIYQIQFKRMAVDSEVDIDTLVQHTAGFSGAEVQVHVCMYVGRLKINMIVCLCSIQTWRAGICNNYVCVTMNSQCVQICNCAV